MNPVAFVESLILFVTVGVLAIFAALLLGRFLRPYNPTPEKLRPYECGEPAIGSTQVQYDIRFYVAALLFIIFDVEIMFFFPPAVVFGKATQLAGLWSRAAAENKIVQTAVNSATPGVEDPIRRDNGLDDRPSVVASSGPLSLISEPHHGAEAQQIASPAQRAGATQKSSLLEAGRGKLQELLGASSVPELPEDPDRLLGFAQAMQRLGWVIALEIAIFFGVLLIGFAYLWSMGDLDWVRSAEWRRRNQSAARHQAVTQEADLGAGTPTNAGFAVNSDTCPEL